MRDKAYYAMVDTAMREVARIRQTFREELAHLTPAERVEFIRALDGHAAPACPPPRLRR